MGLLRLWLALCVVATHARPVPGFEFMHGGHAVGIFFVIAGFFGAFMLETRYRGRYRFFYLNRLLRVWPLYLLVYFGAALAIGYSVQKQVILGPIEPFSMLSTWPGTGAAFTWGLSQLLILGQDMLFFLHVDRSSGVLFLACGAGPSLGYLGLIPQAWSLATEEYFYILAPWFNRLSTSIAGILFLAWLLAYDRLIAICDILPTHFLLLALLPFFGGILSYRFYQRFQHSWLKLPALRWGVPTFYGMLLLSAGYHLASLPLMLLFTACALPWIFEIFRDRPWDRFIGDISYPIYLTHNMVAWYLAAWHVGKGTQASAWNIIGWTCILSLGLSLVAERPLRAWRHRLAKV